MNLILASSSPRRREILAQLQIPFTVRPADIDETPHDGESPDAMVLRLSREKAHAIARPASTDTIILAADTTVVLDGENIGKPQDAVDADAILRRLRGRPHQVFTGVTMLCAMPNHQPQTWSSLCETRVHMRDYGDDEIARWIATGKLYDKAGAYAIQDADINPVARIVGCYLNVMGLPLCEVIRGLNALGVRVELEEPLPHDWSHG
jgi:MAF protein